MAGGGESKKKKKKKPSAGILQSIAVASSSMSAEAPKTKKHKHAGAGLAAPSAVAAIAEDGGSMEDIFGGLPAAKQAKREREAAAAKAAADAAKAEAKRAKASKRRELVCDPIFGEEYDPSLVVDPNNARVHRFDNPSGLNVYKAHHLGLGRGGDTPLCPFDCSCCF